MQVNTILIGDCRDSLRTLPDQSVHCVVTSPPYFGLRDYGVDGQIGQEVTPGDFVTAMVEVFREVHRVLRDDGTLWLNLGDSYARTGGTDRKITSNTGNRLSQTKRGDRTQKAPVGLGDKQLLGIPWQVAFALQADGWYLRQDIIWHKPNPMPESVRDRCTKAHEYVFMFSKQPRYFFDSEAIKERASGTQARPQQRRAEQLFVEAGLTQAHRDAIKAAGITDTGKATVTQNGCGRNDPEVQTLADEAKVALGGYYREFLVGETRNRRSVWSVPTKPFREAHFATYPPALIEPCILAGCPADGTVLDPFFGAGTTGLVAQQNGRNWIGCELNPDYAAIARRRLGMPEEDDFDFSNLLGHNGGPAFDAYADLIG